MTSSEHLQPTVHHILQYKNKSIGVFIRNEMIDECAIFVFRNWNDEEISLIHTPGLSMMTSLHYLDCEAYGMDFRVECNYDTFFSLKQTIG